MLTKNDLKQIRNVVKEEISDSEGRLDKKIKSSEQRIITEVGTFISDAILPQLDGKADKEDVERLEQKLDRIIKAN